MQKIPEIRYVIRTILQVAQMHKDVKLNFEHFLITLNVVNISYIRQ